MNLISSKIRKTRGCTALELFTSIVLRTVGLQQLLHYDVTTHCCATLAQTLWPCGGQVNIFQCYRRTW